MKKIKKLDLYINPIRTVEAKINELVDAVNKLIVKSKTEIVVTTGFGFPESEEMKQMKVKWENEDIKSKLTKK